MANSTVGAHCAQGNVIPFPIRNAAPDPSRAFLLAYHEAVVAKAQYELSWRLSDQARTLGDDDLLEVRKEQTQQAWEVMKAATIRLSDVPAQSVRQLELKRSAIGRTWLKAEGWFYDGLRAGVERDEVRLGATKARRGPA